MYMYIVLKMANVILAFCNYIMFFFKKYRKLKLKKYESNATLRINQKLEQKL